MAIVSIEEVRAIIGVQEDIISDQRISELIDIVEQNTKDKFKINIIPTINIDIMKSPTDLELFLFRKYPLKILELKIGQTEVNPRELFLNIRNSSISFKPASSARLFSTAMNDRIKVKYLNAFMSKDETTYSELTTDILAGVNISVELDDVSFYAIDDWVLFEDMKGSTEVAKITYIDTNTNTITVDRLINDYETGTLVSLMSVSEVLRVFILYEAGISALINAVGGSYNFATGYTYPEYSAQFGVPYTHFVNTIDNLRKNRDEQLRILENQLISIV